MYVGAYSSPLSAVPEALSVVSVPLSVPEVLSVLEAPSVPEALSGAASPFSPASVSSVVLLSPAASSPDAEPVSCSDRVSSCSAVSSSWVVDWLLCSSVSSVEDDVVELHAASESVRHAAINAANTAFLVCCFMVPSPFLI